MRFFGRDTRQNTAIVSFSIFPGISVAICIGVYHLFSGTNSRSNWCMCMFPPRTTSPTTGQPTYRTPPNTQNLPFTITSNRLSPGTSPPPMSDRELSPTKTMEYMGLSPVPPQRNPHLPSGSQSNIDIDLEEASENCRHNCLKQHGYISTPKQYNLGRSEIVPITNGRAVLVNGNVSPICDCALSEEVKTILAIARLDIDKFDKLRQKPNKTMLKLFIWSKDLHYLNYSEVHEKLKKSLKKNSVALNVSTASRRHRDSPC